MLKVQRWKKKKKRCKDGNKSFQCRWPPCNPQGKKPAWKYGTQNQDKNRFLIPPFKHLDLTRPEVSNFSTICKNSL